MNVQHIKKYWFQIITGLVNIFIFLWSWFLLYFNSTFYFDENSKTLTNIDDLFAWSIVLLVIITIYYFKRFLFRKKVLLAIMILNVVFSYLFVTFALNITDKVISNALIKEEIKSMESHFYSFADNFNNVAANKIAGECINGKSVSQYEPILSKLHIECIKELPDGKIEFMTGYFLGLPNGYVYTPDDKPPTGYGHVYKIKEHWYIFFES